MFLWGARFFWMVAIGSILLSTYVLVKIPFKGEELSWMILALLFVVTNGHIVKMAYTLTMQWYNEWIYSDD